MADLMRVREVARTFNVHHSTVLSWIKTGRLPAIRTPGGMYRVDPNAVKGLLAQLNSEPAAPEAA